jgi:broad specificity phosphatase PhoE
LAHLILVRHGQATPFEKITDRLSPVGEAQSRKVAEFWIRNQVAFDEVYTGTLERQRRTAELAGEVYSAAGLPWPKPRILPELNEYDADGVLKNFGPRLAPESHGDVRERNRRFQIMFEAVMNRWITEELEAPGVESWRAFRERVERGLRSIMKGGGMLGGTTSGRRVAAFTSGGPIGIAVQLALNAPARSALEVNWRVRNCSLTEFLFSGARLSLDSFNAIPHLEDPALRTFR